MRALFPKSVAVTVLASLLCIGLAGGAFVFHIGREQRKVEAGLKSEIHDNLDGVHQLRQTMTTEAASFQEDANLLQARANGNTDPWTTMHLTLTVVALTDANWRAASATGDIRYVQYSNVVKFAGAYFEQERLARVQASTLDSYIQLQSYVNHGDVSTLASLTPEQCRLAAVQARLLGAHLRTLLRMTDGLQDAYREALS